MIIHRTCPQEPLQRARSDASASPLSKGGVEAQEGIGHMVSLRVWHWYSGDHARAAALFSKLCGELELVTAGPKCG